MPGSVALTAYQTVAVAGLAALALLLGWLIIRPRRRLVRYVPVGLMARRYAVWRPIPRRQPAPVPVVLVFHGEGGSIEEMERDCGLHTTRPAARFAIVYAEGYHGTWNAGRCCGDAMRAEIDEARFIRATIEDLSGLLNIDRRRVYATGISNGAMLCYWLACNMPGEIAAIAPVNGGMSAADGAPTRPVAILHIQGADDEPIRGETGERTTHAGLSAARQAVAFWREVYRLDGGTQADLFGGHADCTIYSDAGGEAEIGFCVVAGFGDRWPGEPAGGGERQLREETARRSLSRDQINEAILRFFAAHSLPEAQPRRIRLGAATAMPPSA